MINKKMAEDASKLMDKAVKAFPVAALEEKIRNASPEEQKKVKEIKLGIAENLKNGGIKGALKYLGHIRTQI